MRKPRLGEMTKCAICNADCFVVDEEYIDIFNKSDEKEKLYDADQDCFLAYDRCEG